MHIHKNRYFWFTLKTSPSPIMHKHREQREIKLNINKIIYTSFITQEMCLSKPRQKC
jgi:hypothetical protein